MKVGVAKETAPGERRVALVPETVGRYCQIPQDHGLEEALDNVTLLPLCRPALENGTAVAATLPIRNVNRVVGTSRDVLSILSEIPATGALGETSIDPCPARCRPGTAGRGAASG